MMNRTSPIRKHTRFPVRWPMLYGGDDFMSEGTVLDVTQTGWRVAGAMPVEPGMRLTIHLWPQGKPGQIRIQGATVLWVKGCEFALDVPELAPEDNEWMAQFLDQKLGRWLIREPHTEASSEARPAEQPPVSEQMVRALELALDHLQAEIFRRSIVRHAECGKDGRGALLHAQREARRIVDGIQAKRTLRIRTGRDLIADN